MADFGFTDYKEDTFGPGFSKKNVLSDVWFLPESFLFFLLAIIFATADLCYTFSLWKNHATILKRCLVLTMPTFPFLYHNKHYICLLYHPH